MTQLTISTRRRSDTHLIVYNLDIDYDKAHKQFLINSVVCRLSWAVFAVSHNYRVS